MIIDMEQSHATSTSSVTYMGQGHAYGTSNGYIIWDNDTRLEYEMVTDMEQWATNDISKESRNETTPPSIYFIKFRLYSFPRSLRRDTGNIGLRLRSFMLCKVHAFYCLS